MDKPGPDKNIRFRVAALYALITAVCVIVYWMLLRITGLACRLLDLRHGAVLILFFLTYKAIRKIDTEGGRKVRHLEGFAISMCMAALSYGIASAFLFVYLYIDKPFMSFLVSHGPFGEFLNPMHVAFWEFSEGFGMQMIYGMIVMELYKALNRNNDSYQV